jgi:baseplate upper protein BppU
VVDFYIRRGDRTNPIRRTLVDFDGNPIDLVTRTVRFYMTNAQTGAIAVNGTVVTPVDAANGIVQYEWEAGSTEVAGNYLGEFRTTDPEGLEETFPNVGYIEILISPKGTDP